MPFRPVSAVSCPVYFEPLSSSVLPAIMEPLHQLSLQHCRQGDAGASGGLDQYLVEPFRVSRVFEALQMRLLLPQNTSQMSCALQDLLAQMRFFLAINFENLVVLFHC